VEEVVEEFENQQRFFEIAEPFLKRIDQLLHEFAQSHGAEVIIDYHGSSGRQIHKEGLDRLHRMVQITPTWPNWGRSNGEIPTFLVTLSIWRDAAGYRQSWDRDEKSLDPETLKAELIPLLQIGWLTLKNFDEYELKRRGHRVNQFQG